MDVGYRGVEYKAVKGPKAKERSVGGNQTTKSGDVNPGRKNQKTDYK